MVALVKDLDADPQRPPRGRAQNRSDRFVAGPCSKPYADTNLRRVTYEKALSVGVLRQRSDRVRGWPEFLSM
jgi:hypothetical protein